MLAQRRDNRQAADQQQRKGRRRKVPAVQQVHAQRGAHAENDYAQPHEAGGKPAEHHSCSEAAGEEQAGLAGRDGIVVGREKRHQRHREKQRGRKRVAPGSQG